VGNQLCDSPPGKWLLYDYDIKRECHALLAEHILF
jgi:hypothetical protein